MTLMHKKIFMFLKVWKLTDLILILKTLINNKKESFQLLQLGEWEIKKLEISITIFQLSNKKILNLNANLF